MKKLLLTLVAAVSAAALLTAALPAGATTSKLTPDPQATGKPTGEGMGLKLRKNHHQYSFGTDMEIVTLGGRTYAFAGSAAPVAQGGGLHVIDVTRPKHTKQVAWLQCSVYQNDIQISHDQKTLIMAADSAGAPDSCLMIGKLGFMTVDITNPKKPTPIGFAEIARGSHNVTAHPTKPYIYNSDSELTGNGSIQIWSIKNPAKPELVNTIPSLPHSPHDIAFNEEGDRMVTAAISHFDIFDSTDPEAPILQFSDQCQSCSITHDAKFTPDGTHLFVGDEAGGGGTFPCPGGALHSYAIQETPVGPVAQNLGSWVPTTHPGQGPNGAGGCTSHVFDINSDGTKIAISWYTLGTRYIDVSNPSVISELGWFIPEDGDSWSSKFDPRKNKESKFIYSNDINNGFHVYKIKPDFVAP